MPMERKLMIATVAYWTSLGKWIVVWETCVHTNGLNLTGAM